MTVFCLTNKQWKVVVSDMATFNHHATDETRSEIEEACRAFILRRLKVGKVRSEPNKKAKPWQDIQAAAVELKRVVAADPEVAEFISRTLARVAVVEKKPLPASYDDTSPKFRVVKEKRPALIVQIDALIGVADEMTRHISTRPRTPNASDPDLEQLQKRLISFWSVCGGHLGSSTSSNDGAPTGPLIRFLGATYRPALETAGMKLPSNNAIREIIRKIKSLMEVQLLEALFQVAKGKPFTTQRLLCEVAKLLKAGRLKVDTIPLDCTVASRIMWPEWWVVNDPGYWPAALNCWMTALKIENATALDARLRQMEEHAEKLTKAKTAETAKHPSETKHAMQEIRISSKLGIDDGAPIWTIDNTAWLVGMIQDGENETSDQEDERQS